MIEIKILNSIWRKIRNYDRQLSAEELARRKRNPVKRFLVKFEQFVKEVVKLEDQELSDITHFMLGVPVRNRPRDFSAEFRE